MTPQVPVLVIEDDSVFAKVVSKMLSQRGFLPVLAHSVEDALCQMKLPGLAFVMTDIFLPGMGGIDGIKAIRDSGGDTKIIAMSGGWGGQDKLEALAAARKVGANWGLKKPFTADELNEAIAATFERKPQTSIETKDTPPPDLSVFIVDDDPLMGRTIASALKGLTSGSVQIIDRAPDLFSSLSDTARSTLVVSDLNMPGMDGLALLRRLVEVGYQGAICLISGEDRTILRSAEKLAHSFGLNVVGALRKPIERTEMIAVVSRCMEAKDRVVRVDSSPVSDDDLRNAIKEGEVELHYQPKVSAKNRQIVGVEALIRWRHAKLGLLYPNAFIPFAETNGLIDLLTDAVVVAALDAQKAWREQGLDIKVSINLSSQSLGRMEFPELLAAQTKLRATPPGSVIVEVTETGFAADNTKALEILSRLRLMGFGLSIDDFGTGHSSLARLEEAPFNEIKIDRSFVAGAHIDQNKKAILEASVVMAKKLCVSTVAEGVETVEDWDLVADAGVDLVQGYFVAQPVPAAKLLAWAEKWN